MLQQNVSAHYDPGDAEAGEQDYRGGGNAVELMDIYACGGNLIQPVQSGHFCEQLFHIRIIHCLLPTDGFDRIFNHLAGSVAQRRGTVEYRSDKGIFQIDINMLEKVVIHKITVALVVTSVQPNIFVKIDCFYF